MGKHARGWQFGWKFVLDVHCNLSFSLPILSESTVLWSGPASLDRCGILFYASSGTPLSRVVPVARAPHSYVECNFTHVHTLIRQSSLSTL
jgi:hypothetical protein